MRPLDGHVRVEVADRGPGIPPAALAHLFAPFYRAAPNGSATPGTGLGLAVAKGLVEQMRVLMLAGIGTLSLTMPIILVIIAVLAIVVASYQQTIWGYPSGGGSYIVASDNLGSFAGLTAAAALLTDYVLTVCVSVAAGVLALTSIYPDLFDILRFQRRSRLQAARVAPVAHRLDPDGELLRDHFPGDELSLLAAPYPAGSDRGGDGGQPADADAGGRRDSISLSGPDFHGFTAGAGRQYGLSDFPRIASILARDRFMPGVFKFRGERLAFSTGIMLSIVAS